MQNEARNQGYISAETVPSSGFSAALGDLDRTRRIVGAETDQGFMLSNVSEILRSIPEADVAPNKPPRSTICAHTNLTTWLLPEATADLARVRGRSSTPEYD